LLRVTDMRYVFCNLRAATFFSATCIAVRNERDHQGESVM
jgi:hypothetical protein